VQADVIPHPTGYTVNVKRGIVDATIQITSISNYFTHEVRKGDRFISSLLGEDGETLIGFNSMVYDELQSLVLVVVGTRVGYRQPGEPSEGFLPCRCFRYASN
jgi:hypothetical protein